MPAVSRDERAIVLRWRPYGESDKIVTFLTETVGKLHGIGKGARRSRRRFPNSLEPLARVRVRFRLRPGAGLAFLESCRLRRTTEPLTEPVRFAYGSYLAELAEQFSSEEQPTTAIYSLLEEALLLLEGVPATGALLRGFEVRLLVGAGFAPQLERCLSCRREFGAVGKANFRPAAGGFLCTSCSRTGTADAAVPCAVLSQLARLARVPLAECNQQVPDLRREAAEVTGRLIEQHLSRPLRSLKLIAQISPG